MQEELDMSMDIAKESMEGTIDHLQKELVKIRAGKASPAMLNGMMVEYYGSPTPMSQVANISAADSKTLVIQPWEKSMLAAIEKSVFEANLGITPLNDGEVIRLSIPPMTEQRRKDLVKTSRGHGEDAKISLRSARQKAMEAIKSAVKDGYPEDAGKKMEGDVQNMINAFSKKIDALIDVKEKDIMTI